MNLENVSKTLENYKKEKTKCKIYLINGVMLEDIIKNFDNISLTLSSGCLVFYSNVISIVPQIDEN